MKSLLVYHVDDDEDEIIFFNQIMTDLGHNSRSFTNGRDLLNCIDDGAQPDIIFVDIYMPKMTGLEVATLLRDFSSMAETPIIAVTGLPSEMISDSLIENGVNYILEKVPNFEQFKGVIANVMQEQLGQKLYSE